MDKIKFKKLAAQYAELKAQEKALDAEIKALQPEIVEEMGDVIEAPVKGIGTFLRYSKKTWVYPEVIQKLEAELVEKKEKAEQHGEAAYTEKWNLRFTVEK